MVWSKLGFKNMSFNSFFFSVGFVNENINMLLEICLSTIMSQETHIYSEKCPKAKIKHCSCRSRSSSRRIDNCKSIYIAFIVTDLTHSLKFPSPTWNVYFLSETPLIPQAALDPTTKFPNIFILLL